jgi:hypothetical protein
MFFPCDDSTMVMYVQDSTLSTGYQQLADSTKQPVFVRLHGVQRDSGSVYGSQHFLDVRDVMEIRARATGECPGVAPNAPSLQSGL